MPHQLQTVPVDLSAVPLSPVSGLVAKSASRSKEAFHKQGDPTCGIAGSGATNYSTCSKLPKIPSWRLLVSNSQFYCSNYDTVTTPSPASCDVSTLQPEKTSVNTILNRSTVCFRSSNNGFSPTPLPRNKCTLLAQMHYHL